MRWFPPAMLGLASVLLGSPAPATAQEGARVAAPADFFPPLSSIVADDSLQGDRPADASADVFTTQQGSRRRRSGLETHVTWAAPNLHHQPLYFDEPMLERHGVTVSPRLQPALSAAHFFGVAYTLPYRLGVDHPRDVIYTFGHGHPGDPAPCVRRTLPWSTKGALLQGAATAGGALLVP